MKRRVVITGMGSVNPLGSSVAETWENACNGRSGIAPITLFDATELKTQIGGEVKGFDPVALFGRRDARRMDRVNQLAVAAANEAMEQSGLTINDENRYRVGVVIGSGVGGVGALIENVNTFNEKGARRVSPFFIPMMLPDTAPGHIAIVHNLRGPNMSIATACASSNNAMGEAMRMIQRGDADAILTGGTETGVVAECIAGFNAMGALSTRNETPTTASRPFDLSRDGFVPGEGAAILVFEALEHAQARGATIYGEILGYGTSADAYHMSAPLENGEGAMQAMRLALKDAGLEPADVDYINAHGTSTPLNDSSETLALKGVFGDAIRDIPVSSTKSMHGHLLGATSALEAVICFEAMRAGMAPPTINYETADPECDLDYVPNKARPADIKVAMSNGFGFGGHNAVVVLGKYA
ncbi:MAG TPA: beta-ketoacyl-ACP synthase II [Anaerolineae bacterium]|nr:beta-ketoacyl-ACP synthase II [Anaerolineae bacterium]